jgi:hypothetical protein
MRQVLSFRANFGNTPEAGKAQVSTTNESSSLVAFSHFSRTVPTIRNKHSTGDAQSDQSRHCGTHRSVCRHVSGSCFETTIDQIE